MAEVIQNLDIAGRHFLKGDEIRLGAGDVGDQADLI